MSGSQMTEKFQRLGGVVFYQNYWSSRTDTGSRAGHVVVVQLECLESNVSTCEAIWPPVNPELLLLLSSWVLTHWHEMASVEQLLYNVITNFTHFL